MIGGFSKLSKEEKINWLIDSFLNGKQEFKETLAQYWNENKDLQRLHDEFSENTISNYYLPFGIAPNFLINGKEYAIPMTVEESSVVAAASNAAKFWYKRGGFHTKILGFTKLGHVHFTFDGNTEKLFHFFENIKHKLKSDTSAITHNMEKRGGGITKLSLIDKTTEIPHYFQIEAEFNTVDSMGANFINSCLEQFAKTWEIEIKKSDDFSAKEKSSLQIVMSILSNFTPNCIVRAWVECPIEDLKEKEIEGQYFADKFTQAVKIAEIDTYRATTHNKGIMNGIDAVVIATGNDFRAVEACAHAYASKNGKYASLSHAEIKNNCFKFWIDLPISVGTVGGLTTLHPLVKFALELLQKPNAQQLMEIIAVAGLAQNFAALRSLVTTGIQKGHMKMHLYNILNQLGATKEERRYLEIYFDNNTVTHSAVVSEFNRLRKNNR